MEEIELIKCLRWIGKNRQVQDVSSLNNMALAVAAGMGSKSAHGEIKKMTKKVKASTSNRVIKSDNQVGMLNHEDIFLMLDKAKSRSKKDG
mgnify:CR=1 FL=1